MPGFGKPDNPDDVNHIYDAKAKEILESLFPSRRVIQIYTREILTGGGNIHCLTQQIPFFCHTGGTQ